MLKLRIGNRRIYDYQLKIDGEAPGSGDAPPLEDITAGIWVIKKNQTDSNDDAVVKILYDVLTPSDVFLLDTPEMGWVRIVINSSKTAGLTPGRYHFALQLEWGSENKQEFVFQDGQIELIQDTVR